MIRRPSPISRGLLFCATLLLSNLASAALPRLPQPPPYIPFVPAVPALPGTNLASGTLTSVARIGRLDRLLQMLKPSAGPGPTLATPEPLLEQALICPEIFRGQHDPVLWVHGTGANGEDRGGPLGLQLEKNGFDVCSVNLPENSWGDVQVSTEYVVYAVRTIAARAGRDVTLVGHSQGGLEIRWALNWWPDMTDLVGEVVTLAAVHHGAAQAQLMCDLMRACRSAAWQMHPNSNLLRALNRGDETPGALPYTSIYSETDGTAVYPTAVLTGATNISLQQLCPGREVSHAGMLSDAVAAALLLDALMHEGGADPRRLAPGICGQGLADGADPTLTGYMEFQGTVFFMQTYVLGLMLLSEPALKAYVTAP